MNIIFLIYPLNLYNYKEDARGSYFIKEKFELKKLDFIPARLGRIFLFNFVRLLLSFMFGQIIQAVEIELVVKKELS